MPEEDKDLVDLFDEVAPGSDVGGGVDLVDLFESAAPATGGEAATRPAPEPAAPDPRKTPASVDEMGKLATRLGYGRRYESDEAARRGIGFSGGSSIFTGADGQQKQTAEDARASWVADRKYAANAVMRALGSDNPTAHDVSELGKQLDHYEAVVWQSAIKDSERRAKNPEGGMTRSPEALAKIPEGMRGALENQPARVDEGLLAIAKKYDGKLNSPDAASEMMEEVRALGEERYQGNKTDAMFYNIAKGLVDTITLGQVDTDDEKLDPESIFGQAVLRERDPATQSLIRMLAGEGIRMVPALFYIGRGTRAASGVFQRIGMKQAQANYTARVLVTGAFGKSQGGDFTTSAALGGLSPVLGARVAQAAKGLGIPAQKALWEATATLAAGAMMNPDEPFNLKRATVDAMIGVIISGGQSRKSFMREIREVNKLMGVKSHRIVAKAGSFRETPAGKKLFALMGRIEDRARYGAGFREKWQAAKDATRTYDRARGVPDDGGAAPDKVKPQPDAYGEPLEVTPPPKPPRVGEFADKPKPAEPAADVDPVKQPVAREDVDKTDEPPRVRIRADMSEVPAREGEDAAADFMASDADGAVSGLRVGDKLRVSGGEAEITSLRDAGDGNVEITSSFTNKDGEVMTTKTTRDRDSAHDGVIIARRTQPAGLDEGGGFHVRNRDIQARREALGLPEIPDRITRHWDDETIVAAAERRAAFADDGEQFIETLNAHPRALNDVEHATLGLAELRQREIYNKAIRDGEAALAAGDSDAVADAAKIADKASQLMDKATRAEVLSGTETARGLAFRRANMLNRWTEDTMLKRMLVNNGFDELTPEQRARAKRLAKEVRETDASVDKIVQEVADSESGRMVKNFINRALHPTEANPKSKGFGARNRLVTKEQLAQAKEVARKAGFGRLGGAFGGLNADQIKALEMHALYFAEGGVRSIESFRKAMVDELGPKVLPFIDTLYKKAMADYSTSLGASGIAALIEGIEGGRSFSEMEGALKKIGLSVVQGGAKTNEELMDGIMAVVKAVAPKASTTEVREALVGYGKFKEDNRSAVEHKLAQLKAELLTVSKIEVLKGGKVPMKKGREAVPTTEVGRILQKQAKSLLKDLADPEQSKRLVRTSLSAAKARVRNQKEEMEYEIMVRERKPKASRTTVEDQELRQLRSELKDVQAIYKQVFHKELAWEDYEKAEARAFSGIEKSIKRLEESIASGDIKPKKRGMGVTSKRIEDATSRRKVLLAELKRLRALARPKKSPEEIAKAAFIANAKRRQAMYEKKLADEDFTPATRKQLKMDAEMDAAKAAADGARNEFEKGLVADRHKRLDAWGMTKLVSGGIITGHRAFITAYDLSAGLRQGGQLAFSRPGLFFKSLVPGIKSFKSQRYHDEFEASIKRDPQYAEALASGLFLADHSSNNISKREEMFASQFVEKWVPGVGGSSRAYVTMLNGMRYNAYKVLSKTLTRSGRATKEEREAISRYINVVTGRGTLGDYGAAMTAASALFFAPRLAISRFQNLALVPLYRGSRRSRVLLAKEYLRYAVGYTTMLGLAKLGGMEVDFIETQEGFDGALASMTTSDFGKARDGELRLDFGSSHLQAMVLVARGLAGTTRGKDGEDRPHRGSRSDTRNQSFSAHLGNYVKRKLAPGPSLALALFDGRNYEGEEWGVGDTMDQLMPFTVGDAEEAYKEVGISKAAFYTLLGALGVGINVHQKKDEKPDGPVKWK